MLSLWLDTIYPQIFDDKNVIVVAHGNSRAFFKVLNGMSEAEIFKYNILAAVPLVCELEQYLNVLKNYYLFELEELKRRQEMVAKQNAARSN